ncbi:alpha/beta fold hydrolase [Zobellella sp. DQSA1]|uniref:alpha/beta fold hydrolase n=1 Tax=Zobellella sp. DQSA1 TaxID=3342386 RepID=UPI0035BFA002
MEYIKKGNGDYLVLVHGALTDGSMWIPHIEYLESHFEVISVTLSHFEKPEECGFGLNTHADELAELVRKLLASKSVYIVGWSYGADVVLNMLAKEDVAVSKVFLYEPGYPGCVKENDMGVWAADASAMFGKVFEHFSNDNLELVVELLIDGSGNRLGYFQSQNKDVKNLQLSKAYTLASQLNQQEQPVINAQNISNIKVPISFGYGLESRAIFRLATVSSAESSEISTLVGIEGEAHMFPQESPKKFSNYIKEIIGNKG